MAYAERTTRFTGRGEPRIGVVSSYFEYTNAPLIGTGNETDMPRNTKLHAKPYVYCMVALGVHTPAHDGLKAASFLMRHLYPRPQSIPSRLASPQSCLVDVMTINSNNSLKAHIVEAKPIRTLARISSPGDG